MSAASELVASVKDMKIAIEPYPYRGSEDIYFTYLIEDERPTQYAEDKAKRITTYFQLQLSTPEKFNITKMKEKTCELLENAGFSYPLITEINDTSVKRHRIVFQTHITSRR